MAFVSLSFLVQIVGILRKNEHVRIHTRTPENTTLHHPSTHSDTDTDQKHHKSLHFRTHLDQPRNCLFCLSRISVCALLSLCWSAAFDARARGRDPRANFSENRVKSLHIVSCQFTKSHPCPLVIRTVPHLQDRHIRDRRKFAEEMLAKLALGSGRRISRRISTSRRLDLDVICFSDEKIFRVDAAAPGRSFHTFYR